MSQFAKDQVVWGKIKGYPWWPGVVAKLLPGKDSNGRKSFQINFLGDFTHAELSEDKMVDYKTGVKEHSDGKTKLLQDAIKMAQRIHNGTSTLEEERKKRIRQKGESSKDQTPAKSEKNSKTVAKTGTKSEAKQETKPEAKSSQTQKSQAKSKEKPLKTSSKNKEKMEEEDEDDDDEDDEEIEEEMDEEIEEEVEGEDEDQTEEEGDSEEEDSEEEDEEQEKKEVKKKSQSNSKTKSQKKEVTVEKTPLSKNVEKENPSIKSKVKTSLQKKTPDSKTAASRVSPRGKKEGEKEKQAEKKDPKSEEESDEESEKMDEENDKEDGVESEDKITKKQQISKTEEKITSTRSHSPEQELKKKATSNLKKAENNPLNKYETDLTALLPKVNEIFQKGKNLTKSSKENSKLESIMNQLEKDALTGEQLVGSKVGRLFQCIYVVLSENKSHLDSKTQETMNKCGRLLQGMKQQVVQHCFETKDIFKSLNISYNFRVDATDPVGLNVPETESKTKTAEVREIGKDIKTNLAENGVKNSSKEETIMIEEAPDKSEEIQGTVLSKQNQNSKLSERQALIKLQPADGSINGKLSIINNQEQSSKNDSLKTLVKAETIDFSLRKKYGTRFANFLSATFKLDKKKNQETTSKIEKKILAAYGDSVDHYKEAFKNSVRVLKAKKWNLEDLNEINKMSNEEFVKTLEQALKALGEGRQNLKAEASREPDSDVQDDSEVARQSDAGL